MRVAPSAIAARRVAGVLLAVVVEVAALVALAVPASASTVGIPGAVAAAIAGTVAVVFGPIDGILVALAGALAFGAADGWGAGQIVAVVAWPAVVGAAGVFARRVQRQRAAVRSVIDAQERERERVAFELHEELAQTLTSALMALGPAAAADTDDASAEDAARDLMRETIQKLRQLAVELRPPSLAEFGVVAAVERLAASTSETTAMDVDVQARGWNGRLDPDVETALYRVVQEALARARDHDARSVDVRLERGLGTAAAVVEEHGEPLDAEALQDYARAADGVRERVRLVGGRARQVTSGAPRATLRVEFRVA
jgi:signal transduction histidine kinase